MVLNTTNVVKNEFYGKDKNAKYIKQIKRAMRGVSILVIRWRHDSFRSSRPCKHCSEMLRNVGVKIVYYSEDDGSITYERAKDLQSTHLSFARRSGLDM